jgi:protein-S-isoprenylcysteine O-methyltransferase Ste14
MAPRLSTSDQAVISAGPCAVVRNAVYWNAAVYVIGMSWALGSDWVLALAPARSAVSFGGRSTNTTSYPNIFPAMRTIARKFLGI